MKRIFTAITAIFFVLTSAIVPFDSASAENLSYVALGDSVAAGAGLPLKDGAGRRAKLCLRSPQSHPAIIASSLNMELRNIACSGAKADEGIYDSQKRGEKTIKAQLDAAFSEGTPDLITLTIGANDVRWNYYLSRCYYFDCGGRIDTNSARAFLVDFKYIELNTIMAHIQKLSNGSPPTVLINGYYNPLSAKECDDDHITDNEINWLNNRLDDLNSAIRYTASRYSYVHYVPIDFKGHTLCSPVPWVQDRQDEAPFHPTAAGQRAIARANIDKYEQLSKEDTPESYSLREQLFALFFDE